MSSEPGHASARRRWWRWWALGIALALLGVGLVRVVRHRFYLSEKLHAGVDVQNIESALEEFAQAHSGRYPPDLLSLVTPDEDGKCWLEGFNGRVPKDFWRSEYAYEPPTPVHPKPRVYSYGADGKPGGSGEDADIESDSLAAPR